MDSLTQIVLGAACGEIALGKKIGNKALLFGAIGGTIPDLDVFIGDLIYDNQIDAMLFHRGIMHSLLFAVLGAFVFGWLFFKLYDTGKRKRTTTLKDWILLFILSMVTHPLLDVFTPYGTQLLAPFSDHRFALNNIAVVDPLYTLPFLICVIVLMFFKRHSSKRQLWLKLGIGISSAYLLFTLGNKWYIDSIFEKSIEEKGISYQRWFTQPTIFNNILWYAVVETDSDYYVAYYSLLDKHNRFSDWRKTTKSRSLTENDSYRIGRLAWFSNGYFNIYKNKDGTHSYNDIRYPVPDNEDPSSAAFSFVLDQKNGEWDMKPFERDNEKASKLLSEMWERLKGQ